MRETTPSRSLLSLRRKRPRWEVAVTSWRTQEVITHENETVLTVAITVVVLAVLIGVTLLAQQDRYSPKVPDGLAFSEFRGYDTWETIAVSETEGSVKAILGNPTMITYREITSGQPIPLDSLIAIDFEAGSKENLSSMSHHYSGPDCGFSHGDARLDLTDLYAFSKLGDTDLFADFPYVGPPHEERSAERTSAQHGGLSSGSRVKKGASPCIDRS